MEPVQTTHYLPSTAGKGAEDRGSQQKLRLGYLSSDFRNHAVAHQIVGVFKRHDRRRFTVFAYSSGPDDGSSYRQRIEHDVDHFVDITALNDHQAAQRIRADGIDILIDLNGHTAGARLPILAYRPATVQLVHGLSTGSDAIDYILADRFFIPPECQHYYYEKIVYLPNSVMATDCEQPIAAATPDRKGHGLPEQGFVFCCFSSHYKIDPHLFAVWMALLKELPNSVLWLADGDGRDHLQRAATEHGVAPQRLVFAPRLADKAAHLARHRWADLFLDTLRSNAQTTACDALWAGVPVLTCPGNSSFTARVSVSLLHAIGLQDDGLIVASLEEYQQRAVELATHSEELARIRQKLWANRLTQPLFDTDRFVRDLETVLEQVWWNCVAAHYNLGVLMQQQQRHDEAIGCYRQALKLKPDHADGWYNLGLLLQQQGHLDEAVRHYQQALRWQPNYLPAYLNLGGIMGQQQRHDEAASYYQQAIEIQPDYADAWYNLGVLMAQTGRYNEAIHCHRQVVASRPDYAVAAAEMVRLQQLVGDWHSFDHLRELVIEPALAWRPESQTPPPEP
ncbi:MAG: tetratricopeptide repeat protein, partial [Magnetococcales bacterium]|nr:tetratricopeptide repeat protein [Magnetococcales bacterium]